MGKASNRKKQKRAEKERIEQEEINKPQAGFFQRREVKYGLLALVLIVLAISAYLAVYGLGDPGQGEEQALSENSEEVGEPGVDDSEAEEAGESGENGEALEEAGAEQDEDSPRPVVTIEMEHGELIKMELKPEIAPQTVKNFIYLIEDGFYDGLTFHRVIPNFMVQGGCPEGTGQGGPGYNIKGEFSANGHQNDLKHTRGVVSMARSQMPDSAGSQFFIMVEDDPALDGEYAAFGQVIEGMEEVDRIVAVERDDADKPLEGQVMKEVTVETFDEDYEPPEKL